MAIRNAQRRFLRAQSQGGYGLLSIIDGHLGNDLSSAVFSIYFERPVAGVDSVGDEVG